MSDGNQHNYHKQYREAHRERRRELDQAAYARAKAVVEEAKLGRRCKECGFSDPRALDFHHRDPNSKDFAISDFISKNYYRANIRELLLAEIAKCDILCANCHRMLHHSQTVREEGKVSAATRRRRRRIDWLKEIKSKMGCGRCENTNPIVLDFHHKNPEEKLFKISHKPESRNMEELIAEIKKCSVVCANCHQVLERSSQNE